MVEREKLRAVAWAELLPWLNIFRTFRLAIRVRSLLLGAFAIFMTVHGWALIDWVFSSEGNSESSIAVAADQLEHQTNSPYRSLTDLIPKQPGFSGRPDFTPVTRGHDPTPVERVWGQLGGRFVQIFSPDTGLGDLARLLLCGLWTVFIWAWFGGAITRTAALELAADQRVATPVLIGFVKRRWRAYVAAPLFPLLGVVLATLVIALFGLLLNGGLTMWIAAILWPLLLLGGLVMTVLLLGLWFGWPLMLPTISSEGTDSFDALSRTYAYVFQKPLHYLFYIVVAGLFGAVGWLLVSQFAAAVIALTNWAAAWGCGHEQLAEIANLNDSLGVGYGAAVLIHVWSDCVRLLAVGFLYSYFWTAATAIYFLLRRDVDATEMDEVYLDDENADDVYGLPKVTTDEQGAPVVDESAAVEPQDPESDDSASDTPE